MADADLDDFFAKKDKNKKKSKSKTIGDILEKQTDLPKKKTKKKKDKDGKSGTQTECPKPEGGEEVEWNEFKDTEADYSGLRIQNLQIGNKEEEEEQQENEEQGSDEEGEGREKKDTAQGPWRKQAGDSASEPAPPPREPTPEPEPPKEEPKPAAAAGAAPTRYVPPAMRGAGGASSEPTLTPTQQYMARKKKGVLPNIQSEQDFPTLGGGGPDSDGPRAWGGGGAGFEAVRGGSKGEDTSQKSSKLQLGNKYDALSNVDS